MPKTRKKSVKTKVGKNHPIVADLKKVEKKKSEKPKIDFKKIKIEDLERKNFEDSRKLDRFFREKEEISETEEEISDLGFQQFLQPLIPRKTVPVLERVAIAQNTELEQQLAGVRINPRENEEEKTITYAGGKSEYLSETRTEGPRVKYTETPNYNPTVKEKKDENPNRLIGRTARKEWKENEREERWQMEGQISIEETPEKKYLEKGQY
ncbi:MAG: hypothetical protein AABX84_03350 [Nanoarchaeota archaeon]